MKEIVLFFLLVFSAVGAAADDGMPIFHKNDVVLFQGDSITDGGRQREGMDYNHIMGQDYGYIVAAEIGAELPERNVTFLNRGDSGNKVSDLAGRWQGDTLALKPNLLSILVGINDTLGGESLEDYEKIYDKLLAETRAALPDTKIILAEPFLLPVGGHKDPYESQMAEVRKRQEVVARLAEKYNLPVIDYQKVFDATRGSIPPEHWSWDGVHPTYAGHGLMAREWLRVVNEFWPQG